ncbi:hypothetical protein WDU94_005492 [Cyamophila willieti]
MATGTDIKDLTKKINNYLEVLNTWLTQRKLSLSPEKSTASIFTLWTKEVSYNPNIKISGNRLPTAKNPKILGVMLDSMLTYNVHAKTVVNKIKNRNNAIKILGGTSWGKDKETIVTAYKALGRSIINYAAPIWSPQLAQSHWKSLQTTQNAALRTATGCHLIAQEDHLHNECKVLPVRKHNNLLSQQYLLRCKTSNHPCNTVIHKALPPRTIRKMLKEDEILTDGTTPGNDISEQDYKIGLQIIHRNAINEAIINYTPNRVLNTPPPEIAKEEKSLPRKTRTTLAQLRSGWCQLLNSYQNKINNEIADTCPSCGVGPHDVQHLFSCTAKPTHLTTTDLWSHPKEVAEFLDLPTREDEEDADV